MKKNSNGKKKVDYVKGWKLIFKYLFEYKREVIILSVLGIISALANGIVPYVAGKFFDSIINQNYINLIYWNTVPSWIFFVGLWFVLQSVSSIFDWQYNKRKDRLYMLIYYGYMVRAYESLIYLTVSFHKKKNSGEVINQFARTSDSLSQITANIIVGSAPQFLSLFIGLIISFYINPIIALILIAGIVLYTFMMLKIIVGYGNIIKIARNADNKASGASFEAMANIQSIKQFIGEEASFFKMKRLYNNATRLWSEVQYIWANNEFAQKTVVTFTQLSVFILSVYFIKNGTMTLGGLLSINAYAAMIFGPFITLGNFSWSLQNGLVAIQETEKLFDEPKEIYEPQNAVDIKGIKGGIEFKDVYFRYNGKDKEVLSGVNFKVNPGETVALVGESGGGKSTIIDLISAYYFANKGKVLIDGHDIRRINLYTLRKNIAVVPQEVVLFNDTIGANIKYGNFKATDKKIKEAVEMAHAGQFIEKFPRKYGQMVGERGVKLSVGQKQRIAIARAILRDPKILVLDEPTSALDSETEKSVTDSLEKLMKGRTTFIIAHRLSTVRNADKIFVIDNGKIIEAGTHNELMVIPDGNYRRRYEMHIGLR